ncbi:fructose-bisphosphate aldolase [Caldanaerobacter subterraneus subsp. yonseiensis KB-1]|uniref:Fructose-bisphosphate aldolase n=1 Tax=Caldanaerobacter subterraneus subsp. yonseiensis KB-1 TaxID=1388761 RepID=U5CU31_CALSX|nr:class II fructose-bisphosphate aldolase [Caldanaerobacter subterraneus]ERM92431.1 fructose-bisphosphate aldolase [Caldanaerobacter subterraneus subsp. yonseiensis KB-1]
MPLVTSKEMLVYARENGFAVGAFNAYNMEMVQAIIEAAEEENAPVIVQISEGAIAYGGEKSFAALIKVLAEEVTVPVVCHLDHGVNFFTVIKALKAGFTSLMFDGSSLTFEENIEKTKKIAEIAHAAGIPLEGEIGKIPDAAKGPLSPEEVKKYLTTPEEALEFYEKTGVDSLAISVGSAHRMKVQSVQLDIDRIVRIKEKVKIPLVLHGASGVMDESLVQAVKAGISKVNFATELNKAFTYALRKELSNNPDLVDVRKYGATARENVKKTVKEKIQLLNATNKAPDILKIINKRSFTRENKGGATIE